MMTMIIDLINKCHYYSSLQQCERTFSIQQRQTAWICGSHAGCLTLTCRRHRQPNMLVWLHYVTDWLIEGDWQSAPHHARYRELWTSELNVPYMQSIPSQSEDGSLTWHKLCHLQVADPEMPPPLQNTIPWSLLQRRIPIKNWYLIILKKKQQMTNANIKCNTAELDPGPGVERSGGIISLSWVMALGWWLV